MAVGNINAAKELSSAYQPLLIGTFEFLDGTYLRVSTHPLNTAEGGQPYGGNSYLARIRQQDSAAIQSMSDYGIDLASDITLTLADSDKYLFTNYEATKGFAGARLTLKFIFWEVGTSNFSSDEITRFVGICDPPDLDDRSLVVRAGSLLNLSRQALPEILIQKRCPWPFPKDTSQKAEAGNPDSEFYRCGYTGADTSCEYTVAACTAKSNRARFGGVQWTPPAGGRSREYVTGQWINVRNPGFTARPGDYVPEVFGQSWVDALVVAPLGDANSTRFEVILCAGQVDRDSSILKVVVNDHEVPPSGYWYSGTWHPYVNVDPLFCWRWVTDGRRDGTANADVPWNGNGDTYGSMAVIEVVVPRALVDSTSAPSVRVLMSGPKVRVYTTPTVYTEAASRNPIWLLMHLLVRGRLTYADLDIQTFIDAAAVCDASVTYTDLAGESRTHPRYTASLAVRARRSLGELIAALRRSCNAILAPNSADGGKLQVFLATTLADQQPNLASVDGTNYTTEVASKTAGGVVADGYVAYHFDESTILKDNGESSLKIRRRPISDSPSVVTVQLQDEDSGYAPTTMRINDEDAVYRTKQRASAPLQIEGLTSFDQGKRLGNQQLALIHRGNPLGVPCGTWTFEFETSFKAVKVRVGQICALSSQKYGLVKQLVRVTRIQPARNFETCRITAVWHSDNWYLDSFGQSPDSAYSDAKRDRLPRPSFPWCPYTEAPQANDQWYAASDRSFRVSSTFETGGEGSPIVKVLAQGRIPVNDLADVQPPLVPLQANVSSSGGSIAGYNRLYYIAIAPRVSGRLGPLSNPVRASVTASGDTNSISIPVSWWDSRGDGYAVFAGVHPDRMTWQKDHTPGAPQPATVTLTAFNIRSWGCPDVEFDRLLVRAKINQHAGVLGAAVANVGSNSLTIAGVGTGPDGAMNWAGYDLSVLAKVDGGAVPIATFRISGNVGDVLTVSPNPAGIVAVGDVVTIRSKSSVVGLTLTDPAWRNGLSNNGLGLTPGEEVGRILRFVAGTGVGARYDIVANDATSVTVRGPWQVTPDSTSRFIIEDAGWLPGEVNSSPLGNSTESAEVTLEMPVSNYRGQTLLLEAYTMDGNGNRSVESLSPVREIYLFGEPPGVRTVTANTTLLVTDQTLIVDASSGNVTVTLLPATEYAGRRCTIKRQDATPSGYVVMIVPAAGDTIEGETSLALANSGDVWELIANG